MYKTKQINPQELDKIAIKNQAKIKEITGSDLVPKQAWQIIKKESEDFSKESPKALEADALLAELMQINGLKVTPIEEEEKGKGKNKDQERIRVRERERARAIEIIKLKLQIAA